MTNKEEFYHNIKAQNEVKVTEIRKRLLLFSALRVSVFITIVLVIYYFYENWRVSLAISIGLVGLFIFLLSQYTNLKFQKRFHEALVAINKLELKIMANDYFDRPSGNEFSNKDHHYSEDIDLFGEGSFYQYLNRTNIKEGSNTLSQLLLENNIDTIEKRQKAIQELAKNVTWRQEFAAYASLIENDYEADSIKNWIKNYRPFVHDKMPYFTIGFSGLSIVIIALIIASKLPVSLLLYWLLTGMVITGMFLKKVNHLSFQADKVRSTIKQYSWLLKKIETLETDSELITAQQSKLQKSNMNASIIFKQFSSALDTLDNRNNLIYGIFGNGYFLTDIRNAYRVEAWIKKNRTKIDDWFDVISFFDAYNSLGTFAFNHDQYVYPKITDSATVINAKDLGHPLLDIKKRIDNDLTIQSEEFFIITGANMAGKSTFLRTVALHIVMANIGLPVCASSSTYRPIKLITSMRSIDSLKDESSYFFSELTRLKYIVEAIKQEPYFIILDEILKGTNSTDKALGSKKFVEKLVESNATGLIATHDLSLCELDSKLDQVSNFYFDADIIEDELFFDYTFKKGICQNMNASFLLKKMEII